MTDEVVRIRAMHTRLLYPFYYSRRAVDDAAAGLAKVRFEERPVWTRHSRADVAAEFYTSEFHEAALANLFGPPSAGRYLRLPDDTANALFGRRLELRRAGSPTVLPLRFVPGCYAEVFLSPLGVGVLCLTVMLDEELLASGAYGNELLHTNHALLLNYRASQLQEFMEADVRVPHPRDDAARWSRIPAAEREKIPPAPPADAPLVERINAPGGQYALRELAAFLLGPLAGDAEFAPQQTQFSVYTVVRFPDDVDLAADALHGPLGRVMAGLAQVEEHAHAGAVPGQPGVAHELLNKNHGAAVGCLGAAHLVVDQPGDVTFNEERLQRSRDRYFVGFLTSYLQRLAIKRTSDVVGHAMQRTPPGEFDSCAPEFRRVLRDMIEFNSLAYLSEISSREVINRYYRLAQAGMQVADAWNRANQNVASLDAACRTAQNDAILWKQAEDTRTTRETLQESKELHAKVEWVEILIIAVYAAEMFHIVGHSFHFAEWKVGIAVLLGSLIVAGTAFFVLRPDHHVRLPRWWLALAVGVALMGAYVALGWPDRHEKGETELLEEIIEELHKGPEKGKEAGHQYAAPTATEGDGPHAPPAAQKDRGKDTGGGGAGAADSSHDATQSHGAGHSTPVPGADAAPTRAGPGSRGDPARPADNGGKTAGGASEE